MHLVSPLKKIVVFISGITFPVFLMAQSVGINNTTPHASAILDVKSSAKGILIPRTSTSSRIAITTPAKGLMIYDTTTSSFWFYNGGAWTVVANGNNTWSLSGNTGINPANQFIGTTDEQPLRFRINNGWAGEIHPSTYNIFLGLGSGQASTTGVANAALGYHALLANTEGSLNVAVGYEALSGNTTGIDNTALGGYALYNNLTGVNNTAVGRNALFANSGGINNTAIGAGALLTNTFGFSNTATGFNALYSNSSGIGNTATGYRSLYSNISGTMNTATGYDALSNSTTGNYNTANGKAALRYNTTGDNNTANGFEALSSNTTGSQNTATGDGALSNNSTGSRNTAVGSGALAYNSNGFQNTAIGFNALGGNNAGVYNNALGVEALSSNTFGTGNDAYGHSALKSNTTGSFNTAIGQSALLNNITGQDNIAIGTFSGTGGPNAANLSNTVGIGNYGAFLNGASNQVILGNTSTVFIGGKVNWGVISDARIKNSVEEDVKGLSFILKLRPVTYHVSNKAIADLTGNKDTINFPGKLDGEKIKYTGFLAQEVEQAAKASGFDFSGYTVPKNSWEMYTIRYAEFVVPLVKAMQEQQLIIETLRMQVEATKAEIPMQIGKQQSIITNQQKQIELLEKRLSALETKK